MFPTINPPRNESSLDEVIARLSSHDAVRAILLLGSTGKGTLTLASDFDVLVIVNQMPVPIWLLTTQIDHRFSEFYFVDREQVENIVAAIPQTYSAREVTISGWLRSGKMVYDQTGYIRQVQEELISNQPLFQNPSEEELYAIWFRINYDLVQTKRMLMSEDPVYLTAVDLRFLYTIHQVWIWYFTTHELLIIGEKDQIRYLAANDPKFLDLFRKCITEPDRQKKAAIYETLAEITLEPLGGLWREAVTAVLPQEPFQVNQIKPALQFWTQLLNTTDELH